MSFTWSRERWVSMPFVVLEQSLEDTVEFFNLVLELKLTAEEKHNLVEFMRQL
jgi:hypothetical protein